LNEILLVESPWKNPQPGRRINVARLGVNQFDGPGWNDLFLASKTNTQTTFAALDG
jgi:hypothetical protein